MEVLADVTGIGAVKHFTVAQIEKGSLHDKVYIVTGGASGIVSSINPSTSIFPLLKKKKADLILILILIGIRNY